MLVHPYEEPLVKQMAGVLVFPHLSPAGPDHLLVHVRETRQGARLLVRQTLEDGVVFADRSGRQVFQHFARDDGFVGLVNLVSVVADYDFVGFYRGSGHLYPVSGVLELVPLLLYSLQLVFAEGPGGVLSVACGDRFQVNSLHVCRIFIAEIAGY